ncbi:MAG: hypothetical protein KGL53_02480, partial [Elusimicrobia bacterium]|nr:hypothetical protein [Elusimicrobiota bacterium]
MSLPAPRRALVIMLRRVGDVLLTTPAARALRRLWPEAELDFLVEPPADQLLEGDPSLTRVLRYGNAPANYLYWLARVNRTGYDHVYDFMGNPRTAALTFASRAPVRAGPAHVFHRWAYTHRMTQTPGRAQYSAIDKILMLRSLGLDADASDYRPRLAPHAPSEAFADSALAALG